MSSPIHQTSDLDGALRYAPPRVRALLQQASSHSEPAAEEPQSGDDSYDGDSFAGGHAAPPLQRRHSLDPEIVPEPLLDLEENSAPGRLLLRLCGAAAVAAVIAGAIVALPGAGPLKHEDPQADSASAAAGWSERSSRASVRRHRSRLRPASLRAAEASVTEQAPPAIGQLSPVPPGAPSLIIRHLDRDEVRNLVKRGEEFIASGDLAAARLVLQRAAEAGDVRAALALAGTFDPNLLAKRGRQELADAAQARLWYERAKQFGSAEALQRLEQLATQFNAVH